MYVETPTVGQTSGFRAGRSEIHTKFPTKSVKEGLVKVKEMQGYFSLEMVKALGLTPLTYKNLNPPKDPQYCKKCGSPMMLVRRGKADPETGKCKTGYSCNRGGTGCQNMKAKKFIGDQKVKKWLSRAKQPRTKKVKGVQLEGYMIKA